MKSYKVKKNLEMPLSKRLSWAVESSDFNLKIYCFLYLRVIWKIKKIIFDTL